MTITIEERIKALTTLLTAKTQQAQHVEEAKNKLITELVQIQGKLELLNEMKLETKQE